MRLLLCLVFALFWLPATAAERGAQSFDIPGGTLSQAIQILSRQAGVSISVANADLWSRQVRVVRGRMTADEAIKRLLAGSGARAIRVGTKSWRIEPRPAQSRRESHTPKPARRAMASAQDPPPPVPPPQEIVVTATKTNLPSSKYAGVATILDGDDLAFGGERGMDSILAHMTSISSTYLGSGRNKLFIRGIADSSFTGPTQATVGQYFGDIRISYNAPDPDLRLYDIQSVEVLEGPQGTLYGAGSLGGIIRIIPKAPDPKAVDLQAIAGISFTQHGDPGGDLAAIANIPIGETGHALRLVGYSLTDGGYIDNPLLGKEDVNRIYVRGGRASLRIDAGDDWSVDIGGIYQSITSDDAQYADKDAPPLTRNSLVEQGAKMHYASTTLVVAKDWDDVHFQSSNAWIDHRLTERFDAGLPGGDPRILDQTSATRMLTSETRLSRPFRNGLGWVVGTSFVDNRIRQRREIGAFSLRAPITGVTNSVTEFTAYGEATVEVVPDLTASAGLRYTHARLGGMGEDVPFAVTIAGRNITASRKEQDVLPSLSLLATPLRNLSVYINYREGFRPGGLAVDGSFVSRFRNDHVATWEGGARYSHKGRLPFDAKLSISRTRWRDIQADFVDEDGFPTTANIGNGRILSVSGSLALRPAPELSIELGAVYNKSRVDELSPQLGFAELSQYGRIPNVASHTLRGAVNYVTSVGDADLRFSGWANYVGPSRLGIGPVLGEGQGDYVDTGLATRFGNERRGISLTLTNLLDSRGNRFALGTPFIEGGSGYMTPLRPRTVRIAIDIAY